ncbi:MAG: hypothetical protein ACRYGA_00225 [Janthinobacterium lividum]
MSAILNGLQGIGHDHDLQMTELETAVEHEKDMAVTLMLISKFSIDGPKLILKGFYGN